jgi:pseudoazurin
MSKSNSSILILIISMLFISNNVVAASYEIQMLNKLEKEKMLFSKKVIKIDINDEVLWKSVDKGHNVEFIGMPDGALKYKSKHSKDAVYKFSKAGIYLYQCTPHKAMGMIGIVIVGDDKKSLYLLIYKKYFYSYI